MDTIGKHIVVTYEASCGECGVYMKGNRNQFSTPALFAASLAAKGWRIVPHRQLHTMILYCPRCIAGRGKDAEPKV